MLDHRKPGRAETALHQFIHTPLDRLLEPPTAPAPIDMALNLFRDVAAQVPAYGAFLRAQGAVVRGTVAHNSGPVYGAENYEIFSKRRLWDRSVTIGEQRIVPLGRISERALGLSYEGTFAVPKRDGLDREAATAFFDDRSSADIRSERWMRRYLLDNPCCDWTVDYQFWLLGKDSWVAAGRFGGASLFEWNIGLERALYLVSALPTGSRTLVVLHPEYVRG